MEGERAHNMRLCTRQRQAVGAKDPGRDDRDGSVWRIHLIPSCHIYHIDSVVSQLT